MSGTGRDVVVLLVDDEQEFLASAARLLERRGFEVCTATCGEEALAELRRVPVNLVVLDVKMPGMDGEEVFAHVRRLRPELPVIMLTGHGSIPHAFQMSKGGVADYVAKPCDMDTLATRIRSIVGERRRQPLAAPTPGGAVTALVVDDELELLDVLVRTLSRRQIEVHTAATGEAALAWLRTHEVDVVVLDVKMPGLSGLEVLRLIRRDFPDRRVVLLSGHPTAPDAVSGLKLGAIEYLIKPPDLEQLAELVHRGARERRAEAAERHDRLVRESLERQPE